MNKSRLYEENTLSVKIKVAAPMDHDYFINEAEVTIPNLLKLTVIGGIMSSFSENVEPSTPAVIAINSFAKNVSSLL